MVLNPISSVNDIKFNFKSKSTFKAETLKGVKINEPSSAPAKGNKSSSASKVNPTPAGKLKSVKIEDDHPLDIIIQEILNTALQKMINACGAQLRHNYHYDIEWFKRGEALQSKKDEAPKSTRAESSNANRSKTPTRSSHKYLNDLEEYQERALLAKSKRFFKKGTQRFSSAKATDQTECHKCGKKELRPTKDFEAKYNKVKAKLALLSSSASASKATTVKNKGLIAEAYEWDEEEVSSDDNEIVEVKVLMALVEENNVVSKEGTRNGEWVKISMRKKRIMGVDQLTEDPSSSRQKDIVFVKSSADHTKVSKPCVERPWLSKAKDVTDSLAIEYDSADESSACSTPLPPLKKLDGVEPISGPKTIKSILRSKSTFKAKTLKGVTINEPSSAHAKGNKSSSSSKVNSAPSGKLKSVKIKDDPPFAICDIRKPIWYLDSGCSRHMTGVKSYLYKYEEQPGPKVGFGDDSTCKTKGYGFIKCNGIVFTKVAFVNGLKYNLISISQLCDAKYIVQFDEKRGTIFNSNKEVVMIAPRVRDVYVLDMTSSAQESCFFAKASDNLNWLWHKRLAHLNFKTINKLAKQNLVIGLPSLVYSKDKPCSSCEKGKHHRASFKTKQTSSIKKCLHLLHMDLFGPVTPRSINHEKYTLVIVDEYSRYTWVYFLKKKSQAPETIMSFIKRVENQNDIKVKQLRTDNGEVRGEIGTTTLEMLLGKCLGGKTGGLDQISNKDATILYRLATGVQVDYAKIIWDDLIHKINKKTREEIVPYPSFFHLHSKSASRHDALADSIAKADPGLSAPNNSISSEQDIVEGTKNHSFDHIFAGSNPSVLVDKTKSTGDGLKTAHTNSGASKKLEAYEISKKIKLEIIQIS
ncbi:retrovirus-related pol polyprotein from transposon TNT 1-94 [Tanacetum coccineum]